MICFYNNKFCLEDGGDKYIINVGNHLHDYTIKIMKTTNLRGKTNPLCYPTTASNSSRPPTTSFGSAGYNLLNVSVYSGMQFAKISVVSCSIQLLPTY